MNASASRARRRKKSGMNLTVISYVQSPMSNDGITFGETAVEHPSGATTTRFGLKSLNSICSVRV